MTPESRPSAIPEAGTHNPRPSPRRAESRPSSVLLCPPDAHGVSAALHGSLDVWRDGAPSLSEPPINAGVYCLRVFPRCLCGAGSELTLAPASGVREAGRLRSLKSLGMRLY